MSEGKPVKKYTAFEVKQIFDQFEFEQQRRAKAMPTEKEALIVMFDAYTRLKELGFKEAMYCPKDGSIFEAIEAGSTGIGQCMYDGDWPKGHYWMLEAGDMWPSSPILYRRKP